MEFRAEQRPYASPYQLPSDAWSDAGRSSSSSRLPRGAGLADRSAGASYLQDTQRSAPRPFEWPPAGPTPRYDAARGLGSPSPVRGFALPDAALRLATSATPCTAADAVSATLLEKCPLK